MISYLYQTVVNSVITSLTPYNLDLEKNTIYYKSNVDRNLTGNYNSKGIKS